MFHSSSTGRAPTCRLGAAYQAQLSASVARPLPHLAHIDDGFVRIRHFGLLANRRCEATLERCRELLGCPPVRPVPPRETVQALMLRLAGITSPAVRSARTAGSAGPRCCHRPPVPRASWRSSIPHDHFAAAARYRTSRFRSGTSASRLPCGPAAVSTFLAMDHPPAPEHPLLQSACPMPRLAPRAPTALNHLSPRALEA